MHQIAVLAIVASLAISIVSVKVRNFQNLNVGKKQVLQISETNGTLLTYHPDSFGGQNLDNDLTWSVYFKVLRGSKEPLLDISDDITVDVTICDGKKTKSLNIPEVWFDNNKDVVLKTTQKRSRICMENKLSKNSTLDIFLSTRSVEFVSLLVDVKLTEKWVKPIVIDKTVIEHEDLSVSQPIIKYFPTVDIQRRLNHTDYLLITIKEDPAETCLCALVSIQQPRCPIFETIEMMKRFDFV